MNAKKIMGAVLVALLAAALFVGAGAAAETDLEDLGVVYSYTELTCFMTGVEAGMTFTAADGTTIAVVENDRGIYFAADEGDLGKQYTGNGVTFKLAAPTAAISALDNLGVSILGKTVSADVANDVEFEVVSPYFTDAAVILIDENGVKTAWDNAFEFSAGKWGVAASLTGQTNITTTATVAGQVYYFTVAKTDASITAAKDTVNIGNKIVVKVQLPGAETATIIFDDKVSYFEQAGSDLVDGKAVVKLGLDGTGTVAFTAEKKGKTTFELAEKDAEVEVTIEKGIITATADADFFYIGNPIAISGTTTAGDDLYFYIEGTNFPFISIDDAISEDLEVENGAWTVEFDSAAITQGEKTLIAGTYTIVVSTNDGTGEIPAGKTLKDVVMDATYGTATVTMTQPFITDVKAAAVAVQGTEYDITGTAIAADAVTLYIFGTNFFVADVFPTDEDDVFEITLDIPETGMAPGTYFYLIQHPMNDGLFNVWNTTEGNFYYAATNSSGELEEPATFIFNAWKRGTNYAAQALLDTIAGQDIDDIFVQGTFDVEAQKLTINAIPAEVAKGTKLSITGSTNSGEGVEVIVNVLAGKFGATVKGDENAATFLTAKAVTEEDGTFEAAIDTSKLEVGNYIVTVEIDGTMYDSAAVEIVEKAPETPVDPVDPVDPKPVDPVTPTEPETPGFGALAALAGLGAVAVLLLRRE